MKSNLLFKIKTKIKLTISALVVGRRTRRKTDRPVF
jgi:hypothetical protein